ncbi:MAG: hypothetical protein AB7J86_09655 [Vulcanimicrobiota bacterium]
MRKLMTVLLLTLVAQASMFDLPEGVWQDGPRDFCRLEVGTPENRAFRLTYGDLKTTISGTYQVTATKGDAHLKWTVGDVSVQGRGSKTVSLGGLEVKSGDTLTALITWGDEQKITLTVFDPEIQPVFTRTLTPAKLP